MLCEPYFSLQKPKEIYVYSLIPAGNVNQIKTGVEKRKILPASCQEKNPQQMNLSLSLESNPKTAGSLVAQLSHGFEKLNPH